MVYQTYTKSLELHERNSRGEVIFSKILLILLHYQRFPSFDKEIKSRRYVTKSSIYLLFNHLQQLSYYFRRITATLKTPIITVTARDGISIENVHVGCFGFSRRLQDVLVVLGACNSVEFIEVNRNSVKDLVFRLIATGIVYNNVNFIL